jgi:hypothetical protein
VSGADRVFSKQDIAGVEKEMRTRARLEIQLMVGGSLPKLDGRSSRNRVIALHASAN